MSILTSPNDVSTRFSDNRVPTDHEHMPFVRKIPRLSTTQALGCVDSELEFFLCTVTCIALPEHALAFRHCRGIVTPTPLLFGI